MRPTLASDSIWTLTTCDQGSWNQCGSGCEASLPRKGCPCSCKDAFSLHLHVSRPSPLLCTTLGAVGHKVQALSIRAVILGPGLPHLPEELLRLPTMFPSLLPHPPSAPQAPVHSPLSLLSLLPYLGSGFRWKNSEEGEACILSPWLVHTLFSPRLRTHLLPGGHFSGHICHTYTHRTAPSTSFSFS